MQKQSIIRELLNAGDARPTKALGQCFLVDLARMQQVVDLADIRPGQTVLEVGPGTGSLTEELLDRAGRVVAVELDRKLAAIVRDRFAEPIASGKLTLIEADALAGKHRIEPAVMEAVGESADLVANLPYQIATPLVANMMIESWAHCVIGAPTTRFDRLTFTVQKEVAERLAATAGGAFGTVSVLLQCVSDVTLGPVFPAGAFWPAPKIASQLVHVEFDPTKAAQLHDVPTLQKLLQMAFTQRRKHIGGTVRARNRTVRSRRFRRRPGPMRNRPDHPRRRTHRRPISHPRQHATRRARFKRVIWSANIATVFNAHVFESKRSCSGLALCGYESAKRL